MDMLPLPLKDPYLYKFDEQFALDALECWPAKPSWVEKVMYEDALRNPGGLKHMGIDRSIK